MECILKLCSRYCVVCSVSDDRRLPLPAQMHGAVQGWRSVHNKTMHIRFECLCNRYVCTCCDTSARCVDVDGVPADHRQRQARPPAVMFQSYFMEYKCIRYTDAALCVPPQNHQQATKHAPHKAASRSLAASDAAANRRTSNYTWRNHCCIRDRMLYTAQAARMISRQPNPNRTALQRARLRVHPPPTPPPFPLYMARPATKCHAPAAESHTHGSPTAVTHWRLA
jgi:hypothetical protein